MTYKPNFADAAEFQPISRPLCLAARAEASLRRAALEVLEATPEPAAARLADHREITPLRMRNAGF